MLFSFYVTLLSNFEGSRLRRYCQVQVQRLHHRTVHVVHYKHDVMDFHNCVPFYKIVLNKKHLRNLASQNKRLICPKQMLQVKTNDSILVVLLHPMLFVKYVNLVATE